MKKNHPVFSILLFILLILFLSYEIIPAQEMSHKVFRISNCKAESMVPVAQLYLSPGGKIVVDERTNALIVKDYPENLAQIEAILKDTDVPTPQVVVNVKFLGNEKSSTTGIYAGAKKTKNGWVIAAQPNISGSDSSISTSMKLMIMSGSDGFIKMGEQIPYTQWFYQYCLGRGYIGQAVVFKEVSTGFFVSPQVMEDHIVVSIAPGIYYHDGKNRNMIRFVECQTTVSVKDGQTVVIGVGNTKEESTNLLISRILGVEHIKSDEVYTMMLTVKKVKGMD